MSTTSVRPTVLDQLALAPNMVVSDGDAFMRHSQQSTPYGQAVLQYALAWARLMQLEMRSGVSLEQVAYRTSLEAAAYLDAVNVGARFHPLMPAQAAAILDQCWRHHGPRLARWFRTNPGLWRQP